MSSKKQLRRKRRQQNAANTRNRKINPATAFILVTVALIVIVGIVASLRSSDVGAPPWPGAVWSPEHGHWH